MASRIKNQESRIKTIARISVTVLSVALVAAGCLQRQGVPLEAVTSQTMREQTPVATLGNESGAKLPLKQKDPYQTPPYVPDHKEPGPPQEAPQDELPAQTSQHVSYGGQEGKNALVLLKSSHKVDVKTYSGLGEFVDGIDGVKSDAQHFWSFYVNGKQATVGAGSYTTKTTDLVEWKFEKIK